MSPISEERFLLGECPRWDCDTQSLWWVDILQCQLHGLHTLSGERSFVQLPEQIGCFALREGGGFVVGLQSGFAFLSGTDVPVLQAICDPEADKPAQRFNDGRCDPRGRFIAGTTNPLKDESFGRFYQLDGQQRVRPLVGRSWTCNGLAFSPDGCTMYWSDTPNGTIYRCDYDPDSGEVANERVFFVVPEGRGRPDGAAVDSEGCYWSALYAGGAVIRISDKGELLQTVRLPVSNPTMPCFGGPDMRTIYVTSARQKLSPEMLAANPLEGAVMSLRADVEGLPDYKYRG